MTYTMWAMLGAFSLVPLLAPNASPRQAPSSAAVPVQQIVGQGGSFGSGIGGVPGTGGSITGEGGTMSGEGGTTGAAGEPGGITGEGGVGGGAAGFGGEGGSIPGGPGGTGGSGNVPM
jgi:hypothetical protein